MWHDLDRARQVVREFLSRGYGNSFWDDMVGDPAQGPFGCVLEQFVHAPPRERWFEMGFYCGRVLRKMYPNDRASWERRNWEGEIARILQTVADTLVSRSTLPPPSFAETEQDYSASSGIQANGFVSWRLFRKRHPVPNRPGVYVFAHFDGIPEHTVDPLSPAVIYIGYGGHQKSGRTIRHRLDEFEQTAHGALGHSAGWTYRVEFAADWESLIRFRNTYVSWKAFADDEGHPRVFEKKLIADYRAKHGKWPFLNRTS